MLSFVLSTIGRNHAAVKKTGECCHGKQKHPYGSCASAGKEEYSEDNATADCAEKFDSVDVAVSECKRAGNAEYNFDICQFNKSSKNGLIFFNDLALILETVLTETLRTLAISLSYI